MHCTYMITQEGASVNGACTGVGCECASVNAACTGVGCECGWCGELP